MHKAKCYKNECQYCDDSQCTAKLDLLKANMTLVISFIGVTNLSKKMSRFGISFTNISPKFPKMRKVHVDTCIFHHLVKYEKPFVKGPENQAIFSAFVKTTCAILCASSCCNLGLWKVAVWCFAPGLQPRSLSLFWHEACLHLVEYSNIEPSEANGAWQPKALDMDLWLLSPAQQNQTSIKYGADGFHKKGK